MEEGVNNIEKEEISRLRKKYKKIYKDVKKTKSMIKEIHRDRFGRYNDKCKEEIPVRSEDRNLLEDDVTNGVLISFIDLMLEYQDVVENFRLNVYPESIIINGNYDNYNEAIPMNRGEEVAQQEYYYEISICKGVVTFYGNVFSGLNDHYRIKSDIFDLYYNRFLDFSNKLKSDSVRSGFDIIHRISNLNRGRAMNELESI